MRTSRKTAFCRLSLLLTSMLFVNPVLYAPVDYGSYSNSFDDYDWQGFGNDKDTEAKDVLDLLVSPHHKNYKSYSDAVNSWTACGDRDYEVECKVRSFERGLIKQLNEQSANADRKTLIELDGIRAAKEKECKSKADLCGIKLLRKQYNGGAHLFKAVGSQRISREIFLENYKLFGEEFSLCHSGKPEDLMGFSIENKDTEEQVLLKKGVEDLQILKGTSKGVDFCYDNMMASEAPTLGASLAIKNMMLRATTDVSVLSKRTTAIKAAVALLENPETAKEIDQTLAILRNFEDDFLGMKSPEVKRNSVLEANVAKSFYPAAEWFKLFKEIGSNDGDFDEILGSQPLLRSVLIPIKNVMNKVTSFSHSGAKKIEKKLCNNKGLLSIMPIIALGVEAKKFQDGLSGLADIFGLSEKESQFGFTLQDLIQNWNHPTAFANIIKHAGYKIFLEEYKLSAKGVVDIFNISPTEESKKWLHSFITVRNFNPLNLVAHAFAPLTKTFEKCGTFVDLVFGALGSVTTFFPSRRFNNLLKTVDMITSTPFIMGKQLVERFTETLPKAFNNSYDQLIGVSKFFQAAKSLSEKCKSTSELTDNLKLFKYLNDFSQISQTKGHKRTLLDIHRIQVVFRLKAKIKELAKELNKNADDGKQAQLELLRKTLVERQDQLTLENTTGIVGLLQSLESKVFKQRAAFWKKGGIAHIGEVTSTYKAMFELKEHFYPMYQALSELVGIFGIAKKMIASKNDPRNQFCIVDFEAGKDQPHIKVVNGWNPTAVLIPSKGFDRIIPNSFELGGRVDGKEQHMLLTGPNAEGKSTFMRSAAYQIWTAQTLGIAPAQQMTLTPFHYMFSMDKQNESISEGNSKHKGQIKLVKRFTETINKVSEQKKFTWLNCDEMYDGTNTYDASALIILFFTKISSKSICCVSTHHGDSTAAEVKTGGKVVCYKINTQKTLEKGIMNIALESTNIPLMQTDGGCTEKEIAFLKQCVREFVSRSAIVK